MKTIIKSLSVLALLVLGTSVLYAGLLDLRVGAGLSAVNPEGFEDQVSAISGSNLSADTFDTYNADLILRLPAVPVTFGVRYEQANQNQSDSSTEWKMNVNNLALLVDWRLINSAIYVGPIVSVGYPWGDLKFINGNESASNHLNSDQLSYSGGLEAGVYLGPILIGAEAGYKSIHLKNNSSSDSSVDTTVKLDGFYGKAMVGVTFL